MLPNGRHVEIGCVTPTQGSQDSCFCPKLVTTCSSSVKNHDAMPTQMPQEPSMYGVLKLVHRTWTYLRRHSPGRVEPASSNENHGDVSWVVSTPRSPVPALLYLLPLQLKPSLPCLIVPGNRLFAPSLLVLIQGTQRIVV